MYACLSIHISITTFDVDVDVLRSSSSDLTVTKELMV